VLAITTKIKFGPTTWWFRLQIREPQVLLSTDHLHCHLRGVIAPVLDFQEIILLTLLSFHFQRFQNFMAAHHTAIIE
jgi:hypothetical protein